MKRFYASLAALTVGLAGFLLFNVLNGTSNAALPRDCDNNSIIYCGAITPSELAARYTANKPGDLPTIYHSYGLSDYEMTHAGTTAKMGEVHKDGTVTVNGEVVATDATSIGRQDIFPHRTKVIIGGKTYYQGHPRDDFAIEAIVAYVFFDSNGNFKAAVLTSCGNPVHAHPKPKPEFACNALTVDKISRTERKFSASASAKNGATVASYTYDFGDGAKKTTTASSISHNYAPGTYTARLYANITVNGKTTPVTSSGCTANITVAQAPPTPEYTCNSLTVTPIDSTHFKFSTDYTVTNATFKGVSYIVRDASGNQLADITGDTYAQNNPGTYSVQAYVTVDVNGQEKTVTSDACKQQFTVVPPTMVQVCNPATGQTITVNQSEAGNYKPVGDVACQPTTPPTPPELPHTGPADIIGGTVGIGALIAAIGYYVASRRGLLAELLGQ